MRHGELGRRWAGWSVKARDQIRILFSIHAREPLHRLILTVWLPKCGLGNDNALCHLIIICGCLQYFVSNSLCVPPGSSLQCAFLYFYIFYPLLCLLPSLISCGSVFQVTASLVLPVQLPSEIPQPFHSLPFSLYNSGKSK